MRAVGRSPAATSSSIRASRARITLVTERPVTPPQAFNQLLAALRLQGFTMVESGTGAVKVVPEADAKLQGGAVVAPATAAPRGDQIVTQVFRLNYETPTTLVPVLRPLIAPNNTINGNPGNNSLVITDYADNLRRLATHHRGARLAARRPTSRWCRCSTRSAHRPRAVGARRCSSGSARRPGQAAGRAASASTHRRPSRAATR